MNVRKISIKKYLLFGTLAYISVAGFLTAKDWIDNIRQNKKCRDVASGYARLDEGDVQECDIYSEDEIRSNPALRDVKLYFLPCESKEKKPYVLILPGGAYLECKTDKVAMPSAARLNALGYSAFVLRYRIRRHSADYGPLYDLATAVRYITLHADEFNVYSDNYMLMGFSAGGNLACLFGSKSIGYSHYGLPKPAVLSLIYPWTNINAKITPTGNIFTDEYKLLGRTLAANVMMGFPAKRSIREGLSVHNRIDSEYPPCFIAQGGQDFLVPKEKNSDVFVECLTRLGIPYEYKVFPSLSHGFGIGRDTEADGWIYDSVSFWQKYKTENTLKFHENNCEGDL